MTRENASLQRQPFLAPIWLSILIAVAAVAFLGFAAWAAWLWGTANSTSIIVVRHAEGVMNRADSPLTPEGEARAELLSRMFGDTRPLGRLDAIYTSPASQSRMTAAKLASRLGIDAVVAGAASGEQTRSLARRVLREHAGGRILVVGDNDTIPEMVRALSGSDAVPPMPEDDYATMYIISAPSIGRANVLRVTY